jgi:hypothetical protein
MQILFDDLVPIYLEDLLAGGCDISDDAHPVLVKDYLHHTGLVSIQIPLNVSLRDTLEMQQSLGLSDNSRLHLGCMLTREHDVLEVYEEDLVNLEVIGILFLEIPPNGFNCTEQIRNAETELGNYV